MKFIRQASKNVHEWNGHPEIFSRPKATEKIETMSAFPNSRWVSLKKVSVIQW